MDQKDAKNCKSCLIFETFCLERILRDLEAVTEFLDHLILRFLALFLPIFSDLCRMYIYFKELVRRYMTSKMGCRPTISDFLKFVATSAPNQITNN